MPSPDTQTTVPDEGRSRLWLTGLSAVVLAFLAVRVPVMYRQPGGMDEDWFAVPGWTCAYEGIPRVPYAPTRDRESVFYKADIVLLAMPPAYFYWQAPFFRVLPAGYGTARLASAVAGVLAVWLVYELALVFWRSGFAALSAAGLYSLSRVFYFPATTARPDMLCGMLCLATLRAMWSWHSRPDRQRLLASGGLAGAAMLTHPFGVVVAIQGGVWCLLRQGRWTERVSRAAMFSAAAGVVLLLWTPLVFGHREIFIEQFFGNVLNRSGPGLLARVVWPWPSIGYHARLMWEHAGPWQSLLMAAAGVGVVMSGAGRAGREQNRRLPAALIISSVFLLIAAQGMHPSKGYWCYPGAMLFVALGGLLGQLGHRLAAARPQLRHVRWMIPLALAASLIPGSGLRASAVYVAHWNDADYNAGRFVQDVLPDVPPGARLTVDPGYVFHVWLARPETILGVDVPMYFSASEFDYDALLVSRYGLDNDIPDRLNGQLVERYGNRNDPFACYLELYRPQ